MKHTILEREAQAERMFRDAFRRHPRAGRTMRLHWEWTKLKAELIAHEEKLERTLRRKDAA